MNGLVQASSQGASFKEVFYEDEIITETEQVEALKKLVPNEEYENIQKKIIELKASDIAEKFEKRAGLFIIGGVFVPASFLALYIILGIILNFQPSLVLAASVAALMMFIGIPLGSHNIKKEEEALDQKDNALELYRTQLLNAFFNGNVVGEVENLNKKDWRKIKVIENGKTETYMVRIKIDDKGVEHIDFMKVVETDQ